MLGREALEHIVFDQRRWARKITWAGKGYAIGWDPHQLVYREEPEGYTIPRQLLGDHEIRGPWEVVAPQLVLGSR